MFALIDCNNFYVSCERVFQPELRGKAGVVLSNNDGCAIARSQEAKDLGIKMGTPYFELEKLVEEGKLWFRSSNYTLYQDMMRRVTSIVCETWPEMEIYSIDESFCDLRMFHTHDLEAMATRLRAKILQCTGIPVCIGIGRSRTLAKVGNRIAKKYFKESGVCVLDDEPRTMFALQNLPIEDVWGIGPRNAAKLIKIGVNTAYDFATINNYEYVEKRFTVTGLRTWYELNGKSVLKMEYVQPDKKGICTGRSFGQKTDDYKVIEDALCAFVQNSAPKLRAQGSLCGQLQVFLHTSQFEVVHKLKSAAYTMELAIPTNITQELLRYAVESLKRIYRPGYPYQKVGIFMTKLTPAAARQTYLLEDMNKRDNLLTVSRIADRLNKMMGKDMVRFAAMGYVQPWKMRQGYLSKRFTTRIDEVLRVGK
ncbi:Y-family DNA polymerase [Mucilaginibacter pallidiroseus]|uniref:Y-family DNA polymerase n=1 Tax=Mucilaginibacter pallidiroseus TaxID=2599295 RepID=A0A563U275_9SPHI|nr:Y-family DNA polymerase [Mucilaginibacter pallidiroseus]TWR25251.1 Y-family DNA polymerase [Mucilaginibacter pallidiroseus]